jgi:hypothetical protein
MGIFSSEPYNTGINSIVKTINWSAEIPNNSALKLQLRSASSKNGLYSKNFIGPDGSISTYYNSSPNAVWSGHGIDQWIQYRVYINTSDPNITPKLKNVTIIYNHLPETRIFSPSNNLLTINNTQLFKWTFNDTDSNGQSAFHLIIDDDINFKSIEYNSTIQNSQNESYQFNNPISDGTWYWKVRTKDSDGDWGPYSTSWRLTIDTTNPTSTITNPINNSFANRWKLGKITGTAADINGSGLERVEITIKQLSDNKYWDRSTWDTTEYWLNCSGTTNWSYDVGPVGFQSGVQYLIRSRATDNASNVENSSYGVVFTFDSTKPTSGIIYPINGYSHNSTVPIVGASSDTDSGIHSVEVAIRRTNDNRYWSTSGWLAVENWLLADGREAWSFNGSGVTWTSGYGYEIKSRAVDNASNVETPSTGNFFYSDLDNPTSAITSPTNGAWLNDLDEIRGTFSDTGPAGIYWLELLLKRRSDGYYWDGSDWGDELTWLATQGGAEWYYDTSSISWQQNEIYVARSRAMDAAANFEVMGPGNEFYFDFEKPSSTINEPLQNAYLNELSTISGTGTDTGGSGFYVELKIQRMSDGRWWDGLGWVPEERILNVADNETWRYDSSDVTWTSNNSYNIFSMASDNAGNQQSKSGLVRFTFDNNEPTISIKINDDAEFTNSSTVTLSLTAFDPSSGVDQVSYSKDNKSWSDWEDFSESKNYQIISVYGERGVYYRVKDLAGNIAQTYDTIILDPFEPLYVDININHAREYTNSREVILSLNATDELSGLDQMSFSFDGSDWTRWEEFAQVKYLTLKNFDGVQTVHFRVSDKAGNIAEVTDSIVLDTEPPHSLKINISKYMTGFDETTVIYHLSAIDDLSGVSQMAFIEDGETWTSWMGFSTEGPPIQIDGYVDKTIHFKVKDRAGNEAEPVYITLVINASDFEEILDNDKDGVVNKEDAFPEDMTQWSDKDGDNYGDNPDGNNPDAFPDNASEWSDRDGDNYGDNSDVFPDDPTKWQKEEEQPPTEKKPTEKEDNSIIWITIGAVIVIIVIVILILFLFLKRKKKHDSQEQETTSDQIQQTQPSQIPPLPQQPQPPQQPPQMPFPPQQFRPAYPPTNQNQTIQPQPNPNYPQSYPYPITEYQNQPPANQDQNEVI